MFGRKDYVVALPAWLDVRFVEDTGSHEATP